MANVPDVIRDVYLTDASGAAIGTVGNPLNVTGGGGAGGGTSSSYGAAFPATGTAAGFSDGTALRAAYVASFHNADNQPTSGAQFGLLTGGVAQILNQAGTLDRQRGTGFDGIPAVGIATGTQQLATGVGTAPFSTTFNGAVTGNAAAQTVTVVSTASLKVGDILLTQDNVEYCEVNTVPSGTTFTAILKNSHASGQTVQWWHYNQARDATAGDKISGAGLSPSATYLYNVTNSQFELDRSAAGEMDGATGSGTAVAAGYEWNGGGPTDNTGLISGLAYDRARSTQGKGLTATTLNGSVAAGATSIVITSATGLEAGQQLLLDRAGTNPEACYVSTAYTVGSTTVALQSKLGFLHANGATAEWDDFNVIGPALNGFTAAGVGIDESVVYDPVSKLFFLERSATQDGVSGQNLVMEGIGLWNGATFDRMPGSAANGAKVQSIPTSAVPTDGSLTITTGGTAQTGPASNASRKYLFIQNPSGSGGSLWWSTEGTAVQASPSIEQLPGSSYENPPHMCFTGAVSIIHPVTSAKITIRTA